MDKSIYELALINAGNIITSELFLKTGLDYTRPTQVYAQISEKCNSRCAMCDSWRENRPELSAQQWNAGIKQLKSAIGRFKICFTGGEVLVKEDFFEILEFCKSESIPFGITTNGIALNTDTIKRLMELYPFNINFSLDSLDENNYRKIRGVPCLETVKSNIQKIVEYKEKLSSNIVITIKTVVNSKNLHELCQITEYAQGLRIHGITFDKIKRRRRFFIENVVPEFEELYHMDYSSVKRAVNGLIAMKKAGYRILNSEESIRQWEKEKGRNEMEKCTVPLRNLYIDAQGGLKFCENIGITIGNINDADIRCKLKSKNTSQIKKAMADCKEPCDYCIKRSIGDYAKLFFRFVNIS